MVLLCPLNHNADNYHFHKCSGNAYRAVDGNDNSYYQAASCTWTGTVSAAWWLVDLGTVSAITGVALTNREDYVGQCNQMCIFIMFYLYYGKSLKWP